jgi:hypothetical protein
MLDAAGVIDNMDLNWPELDRGEPPPHELIPHLVNAGLLAPGQGQEQRSDYPYATPPPDIEDTEIGSVLMVRGAIAYEPPLQSSMLDAAQACLRQALCLITSVEHGERFTAIIEALQTARGDNAIPATVEQATKQAEIIRHVGDPYPNKVACLERTLSVALLGARQGLDIETHMGAGVDPIDFHAWPVAQGKPIRLEYDDAVIGRYHSVFRF